MNKNTLRKRLEVLNLSEKETRVYLATLENGSGPASKIAEEARMNRVSTYGILETLLQRDYVQCRLVAGVKHFRAVSPGLLMEDKKQKLEALENVLPLLKSMEKTHHFRPGVRFFEGMDNLKKAYMETLKSTTEICGYASVKNILPHWSEYMEEYVLERKKKNIFLRGLSPDNEIELNNKSLDQKYHREMRFLPKSSFEVENKI